MHQHILEAIPSPGSSEGEEGQIYDEHNATTISAHYRSWYASETDNVIRGKVSSRSNIQGLGQKDLGVGRETESTSTRDKRSDGRLNVIIGMHREPSYPDASPLFRSSVNRIDDMTLLNRLLDPQPLSPLPHASTHAIAYSLDVSLTSSPTISLPVTVSCGFIICHFPSPSHSGPERTDLNAPKSYIVTIGSNQAVVCNGASDIDIVLSIETDNASSYKRTNSSGSNGDSTNEVRSLNNKCKRTMHAISQFSFAEIEARHSTLFEERMSRTSLDFSSSSPLHSQPSPSYTGRPAGRATVSAECKARQDALSPSVCIRLSRRNIPSLISPNYVSIHCHPLQPLHTSRQMSNSCPLATYS